MASQEPDRVNLIKIAKEEDSDNLLVYTDGSIDEGLVMQLLKMDPSLQALIYCANRARLIPLGGGKYRLSLEKHHAVAV